MKISRMISVLSMVFLLQGHLSAQSSEPDVSDYKYWTRTSRETEELVIKGRKYIFVVDGYQENEDDMQNGQCTTVYYKPIRSESPNYLSANDPGRLDGAINAVPWYMIYMSKCDYNQDFYLFERTGKWTEFYRLWRPKWRFVKVFPIRHTLEGEAEDIYKFLSERYKIEGLYDQVDDKNPTQ